MQNLLEVGVLFKLCQTNLDTTSLTVIGLKASPSGAHQTGPARHPRILGVVWLEASLRSARLKAFSRSIWVSLHSIRLRPWSSFLLFFEHQTSHATCFNARGLLYESVFDTLLLSSLYRPIGNLVSHQIDTWFTFLFWIITPPMPSAPMLRYYSASASLTPSNFSFVISIYWKSTSYRSSLDLAAFGKTTNRSTAKLKFFFFSLRPTCMLFDSSMASRLFHDHLEVAAPTHRSGLVRHGYP
jgi:hypothetical protein